MTKPQGDIFFRAMACNLTLFYLAPSFTWLIMLALGDALSGLNQYDNGSDGGWYIFMMLLIIFLISVLILLPIYKFVFKFKHFLALATLPPLLYFLASFAFTRVTLLQQSASFAVFYGYAYWYIPLFITVATIYVLVTRFEAPKASKGVSKKRKQTT